MINRFEYRKGRQEAHELSLVSWQWEAESAQQRYCRTSAADEPGVFGGVLWYPIRLGILILAKGLEVLQWKQGKGERLESFADFL